MGLYVGGTKYSVVLGRLPKQYRSHYNDVTLFIYEGVANVGVQEDEYKWTVVVIETDASGDVIDENTYTNVRWSDYENL